MHTLLLKKQGYLEESTTANLQAGQSFRFAPALKPLGTTDEIKIGGVNNRVLDKPSPLQFYLNPGNYVIDITMSGYKDIHRVITVEKSGKLTLDEDMERQ